MAWIDELMQATEELESPRRYFLWSGLSAISAVVKRNVYLDKFAYYLYPNIYVMLVGKSGIRKGVPPALAKDLVARVNNTRVIAGRSSIEGILSDLATATTKVDGSVDKSASGFIISGEFSQSILQNDQALTILTNLYDGHYNNDYVNLLKSGKEKLKEVYITLLGASNPVLLREILTQREALGGFVARTLMVYETRKARVNDLLDEPLNTIDKEKLAEHLKALSTVRGKFVIDSDAKEFYRNWYSKYEASEDDTSGTSERIHDTILKVAMLLSLSRGYDLIISEDDMKEAYRLCMDCNVNAQRVTMGGGGHHHASQTKLVMDLMLKAEKNEVRRTRILNRYWGEIDSVDLDRIIDTLQQGGIIDEFRIKGDRIYKLKAEVVEQYDAFLREEKRRVN